MKTTRSLVLAAIGVGACLWPSQPRAETGDEARRIARGDYHAPRFSPDGQRLLVTGARMHGLAEITLRDGKARLLLDEARVGLRAAYLDSGEIAFEAKRAGQTRELILDAQGRVKQAATPKASVFAHRDRIYLRTSTGLQQVGSGDRFFGPRLSPDRSKVAYVGLATGVYVYDIASGKSSHLGPGTAPSWSPDSQSLAYEWTEDDGHSIVASDLWLWRASSGPVQLTNTAARLERNPSFSPDGKGIAFDDSLGSVYVLNVEAVR